ncbi:MAG: hypothetical protein ACPG06_08795 [Alphaproteobacteria bacterium]
MNKISVTALATAISLGVAAAPAFAKDVEITGKPTAKAEAPTKNQVRGWDPTEKKAIQGKAKGREAANEEEGGGAAKTQPKGLTSQSEFQEPVSKTELKGLISPSEFNQPAGK